MKIFSAYILHEKRGNVKRYHEVFRIKKPIPIWYWLFFALRRADIENGLVFAYGVLVGFICPSPIVDNSADYIVGALHHPAVSGENSKSRGRSLDFRINDGIVEIFLEREMIFLITLTYIGRYKNQGSTGMVSLIFFATMISEGVKITVAAQVKVHGIIPCDTFEKGKHFLLVFIGLGEKRMPAKRDDHG